MQLLLHHKHSCVSFTMVLIKVSNSVQVKNMTCDFNYINWYTATALILAFAARRSSQSRREKRTLSSHFSTDWNAELRRLY